MEVVQNFNKEMKGLLDHRPPVSRQKMSMITKSAIRGIKFYKHIVQSVEKFIQKCSPDYKVPGLYVMDAIIRQSRHQYGAERDVFAPRFLKNLLPTFQQLFRCDEKDKHLVIRVLNLWLKNETFAPEVIQSLLTLADNPEDANLLALAKAQISIAVNNQTGTGGIGGDGSTHRQKRPHHHHHRQRQHSGQADFGDDHDPSIALDTMPGVDDSYNFDSAAEAVACGTAASTVGLSSGTTASGGGGIISSVAELLQKFQDTDDVRDQINQLQSLQDKILQQSSLLSQQQMIDPEILGQLQALMEELTKTARAAVEREQEAQRAKDVIAFDYGDDSDEDDNIGGDSNGLNRRSAAGRSGSGGGSSVDQNFLDQLQQMTETLAQTRVLQEQLQSARLRQQLEEEVVAEQQQLQDEQYYQQHHQHHHYQQPQRLSISYEEGEIDDETKSRHAGNRTNNINNTSYNNNNSEVKHEDFDSGRVKRENASQSRSSHRRPRSPPASQQQQQPPPPPTSSSSSSRRRRRSHSGGGRGESSERRRKERKRKALPRLRDGRLSIVSATIFIGKLQKSTTEAKLRSLLDEYGQVQGMVLIASRGCCFVVYSKRKHAAKAIDRLRSTKLDGASLRVAWAPNKGIKDTEMKEFWDEEEGCTYIPYEQFPRDSSWRDLLQGGAFVDQDSVPLELVDLVRSPSPSSRAETTADHDVGQTNRLNNKELASVSESFPAIPPPPPPPSLSHPLLMMPPPMPMPHFSAFIPPPPLPMSMPLPPMSAAGGVSTAPGSVLTSPKASSSSVDNFASSFKQPQPPPPSAPQRTTLLPMPPPQPQHQPYVRTPVPPQRPPPLGFFRGGGRVGGGGNIGSGILPQPPFGPRGGIGSIGAWRPGGIGRGL